MINNIYVLGGHKLSSDYITKLKRAQQEGLIKFNDIFYVDETPGGWVQKEHPEIQQIVSSYVDFLSTLPPLAPPYKGGEKEVPPLCKGRSGGVASSDLLVPDHTAPHVLFQLFIKLAEKNNIKVEIKPFTTDLKLPFQKTFESGVCAISYATWICPIDCDEPAFCPGKNNERDWDFEFSLSQLKSQFESSVILNAVKDPVAPPPARTAHIFNCPQLAYGVVAIPVQHIASEWIRLLAQLNQTSPVLSIIATHTKCHGILGQAQFG